MVEEGHAWVFGRIAPDPALVEARGSYRKNPARAPKGGKLRTVKPRGKAAAATKDYVAIARRYMDDVLAGRIVVGQLVKLAVQRQLDDLQRQKDKDFPFKFDEERANKFCALVERYPHIKGKWAAKGESIQLQPWQCFALVVPFGWVQKEDGLRRFREIYLQVARKNAKSTLAAAIGNLELLHQRGQL